MFESRSDRATLWKKKKHKESSAWDRTENNFSCRKKVQPRPDTVHLAMLPTGTDRRGERGGG